MSDLKKDERRRREFKLPGAALQRELDGDEADVLVVTAPVQEISGRLVRKMETRERKLHWNSVLHSLDTPLCEHCRGCAHPVGLCEKVHCLCGDCWSPCPRCARLFGSAGHGRCRCQS